MSNFFSILQILHFYKRKQRKNYFSVLIRNFDDCLKYKESILSLLKYEKVCKVLRLNSRILRCVSLSGNNDRIENKFRLNQRRTHVEICSRKLERISISLEKICETLKLQRL